MHGMLALRTTGLDCACGLEVWTALQFFVPPPFALVMPSLALLSFFLYVPSLCDPTTPEQHTNDATKDKKGAGMTKEYLFRQGRKEI